ncbi:hypothetical protein ADL27_31480, partial [Streptomyces sp. NRRL F-6602]
GLPRRRVITRHLLRNSLIPVVTFIGTDIGALMGGAIVTERIFNIHGVGFQLYQGILRQNTQTVVGFVTVLVLVFLVANLIVDLLYAWRAAIPRTAVPTPGPAPCGRTPGATCAATRSS